METKILSGILTCVNLMLVQGLDLNRTDKNPDNSIRRILNGQPASVENYRYLVRLENYGAICGGAIINEVLVLTAAHCIYSQTCSDIEIHPGQWHPQMKANAVECYPHPQFTGNLAYDIGLIKSGQNLLADTRLEFIPLPQPGAVTPPGTSVIIAGWGQTESSPNPRKLFWAEFMVKDWDFCNMNYASYCLQDPNCVVKNIPRRILCVQGKYAPVATTCLGDSGGPVVLNNVVVGVDSSGMPGKDPCPVGAPSLHTNVADYLPWIFSIINPGMDTGAMPVQPEIEY